MSTATLCDTSPGVRRKGEGKEALTRGHARSGPVFDDPGGVDVLEARSFFSMKMEAEAAQTAPSGVEES